MYYFRCQCGINRPRNQDENIYTLYLVVNKDVIPLDPSDNVAYCGTLDDPPHRSPPPHLRQRQERRLPGHYRPYHRDNHDHDHRDHHRHEHRDHQGHGWAQNRLKLERLRGTYFLNRQPKKFFAPKTFLWLVVQFLQIS